MDFSRALAIIGKRKWIILASVFITTCLVYGVTRLTPSRWLATVRIITPSGSALSEAVHKLSDLADMDSRSQAAVYASIARSQEVLRDAAGVAHINDPFSEILKRIEFEASGSRMFELRYFDTDPARARDMANALADGFIAKNRSLNSQEAERTTQLLDKQLKASERRLALLHERYDKYCLDNQIAGDPVTQLNTVLKRLEAARASKEAAIARIAQEQSQLVHAKNAPSSPTIVVERPAIASERLSRLERQLGDLDDQIRLLRRRYNDTHPEVKELLSQRQQIDAELKGERTRMTTERQPNPQFSANSKTIEELGQLVASDEALIRTEDANIAVGEGELGKLRTVNSPLGELTSEITSESENRAGLASRLNVAKAALDVAQRQNPLTVLEYVGASNPSVNTTAGRTQKLLLLAALSAFILASGLAIAFENLDRRLKTVQQAEELLPARVLAAIPQSTEDAGNLEWARVAELRPLSVQSEAYRFLGQHLLSASNRQYRSLMALSAKSGQGSTRAIANLAITLAQAGQTVLLVDANLRHPDLHRVFELSNEFGLTDILRKPEPAVIEQAMQKTTQANLMVITSGPAADNPWELFSSHRLQELSDYLRSRADYVLYDTPSALAYTDTLSLSGVVDGALLCVRAIDPISEAEQRLGEMFALSEVQIIGCVLVDAPASFLTGSQAAKSEIPRNSMVPAALLSSAPVQSSIKDNRDISEITNAADFEPAENSVRTNSTQSAPASDPASDKEADTERLSNPAAAASVEDPKLDSFFESYFEPRSGPDTGLVDANADQEFREDPVVTVPAEPVTTESGNISEENNMATGTDTPPGGFPKAIHGYAVAPVDDYVRKINARLESLLMQVQVETNRADQSKRVMEQMTVELEALRRKVIEAEKRETAEIDARTRAEEMYARLEEELKHERDNAGLNLEKALAEARKERETLLSEERQDAESVIADARRTTAAQLAEAHHQAEQLKQETERLEEEAAALRRQLDETRHKEPGYSEQLVNAEAQRVRLEAEIEAQRVYARSQIELIVTEARRNAEEAGARAASVYREHEERVRALGEECEALVSRIRRSVESQLNHLPAFALHAGVSGNSHPADTDETHQEEKHVNQNRDWRGAEWRAGSDWRSVS